MVLDLRQATQCIETMKEYGTYRNHKIGRIKIDFPGDFTIYKEGKIVLFKEYGDCTTRVTVEFPMSQEEIKKQKENKSLLTTVGTIVHVPRKLIEEILI